MLVIRKAGRRDATTVGQLLARHIVEHQRAHPDLYPRLNPTITAVHYAAFWQQVLETDPAHHVWLAGDRDVRGFLAGEVWTRSVGEPTPVFFAEWLYVLPESRGQGIARALWRACVEHCQACGIDTVEGVVAAGDEQWVRRGWRVVSTRVMRPLAALAADVAERECPRGRSCHDRAR